MSRLLGLTIFLVLVCSTFQLNSKVMSEELEAISRESQDLADELSELMARVEGNDNVVVDQNIFREIIDRIQEIGEATEEENLIELSKTVKKKRQEEQLLFDSIKNLEKLEAEIKGLNVEENINKKVEELLYFNNPEAKPTIN